MMRTIWNWIIRYRQSLVERAVQYEMICLAMHGSPDEQLYARQRLRELDAAGRLRSQPRS